MIEQKELQESEDSSLTSIKISKKTRKIAEDLNIKFKDALDFGVQFLAADSEFGYLNGVDYPKCNLTDKFEKIINILTRKTEEIFKLEEENKILKEELNKFKCKNA